jgi:hypothetical protein
MPNYMAQYPFHLKMRVSEQLGASIQGASMTEYRPPSELAQRRSGVLQSFP